MRFHITNLSVYRIDLEMVEENLCRELYTASLCGNRSRVKDLLDLGADPNDVYRRQIICLDDGATYLMVATMQGHIDVVEELVNYGAKLDAKNDFGYTALMISAHKMLHGPTSPEIMKFLMQNGCSTDTSVHGFTFLDYLSEEMRIEMEEYIDSLFVPKPARKEKEEI